MYNDADLEMREFEDAALYGFCCDCGDEFRRGGVRAPGDLERCRPCIKRREELGQEMRDYMAFGIEGAPDYADEHDSGQLRIAVAGEQVSLLPLPDELIPTTDEPQAVDELRRGV